MGAGSAGMLAENTPFFALFCYMGFIFGLLQINLLFWE
jgi:hypothetical protein